MRPPSTNALTRKIASASRALVDLGKALTNDSIIEREVGDPLAARVRGLVDQLKVIGADVNSAVKAAAKLARKPSRKKPSEGKRRSGCSPTTRRPAQDKLSKTRQVDLEFGRQLHERLDALSTPDIEAALLAEPAIGLVDLYSLAAFLDIEFPRRIQRKRLVDRIVKLGYANPRILDDL